MFQYFLVANIVDENAYSIVTFSKQYGERIKERFDESKLDFGVCGQSSSQGIDVVLTTSHICASQSIFNGVDKPFESHRQQPSWLSVIPIVGILALIEIDDGDVQIR